MSAISAIYVLDQKGKVLISRDYRGDIPPQCVDRFVQFISGAAAFRHGSETSYCWLLMSSVNSWSPLCVTLQRLGA